MKILLFAFNFLVFLNYSNARADLYTCKIEMDLHFPYLAQTVAGCTTPQGGVFGGYMLNVQKAASINYTCGNRAGTLTSPSSPVINYRSSENIIRDAQAQGISLSTSDGCKMAGFTVDSASIKFYEDSNAQKEQDKQTCNWVPSKPGMVISTLNASGFKIDPSCSQSLAKSGFCGGLVSCGGGKPSFAICNPNQFAATTFGESSASAATFKDHKLAVLKNKAGEGFCIGENAGCLYENGACGTESSCAADHCAVSMPTVAEKNYSEDPAPTGLGYGGAAPAR
jgi:hypothetical protein